MVPSSPLITGPPSTAAMGKPLRSPLLSDELFAVAFSAISLINSIFFYQSLH